MNMASPVVLKVLAPSSVAGQHSGEKSELTCTSITSNGPRSRESTTSPLPLEATSLPLLSSKLPAPLENGMPPCSVGEAPSPSSAPKQTEELRNEFVAEMTAQVASSVHSGASQLASTLNPMSSFSAGTDLLAPMNELLAPISAGADLLVPISTVEDLLAPVSTSPPDFTSTFNLGAMEVSPVCKADDVALPISNGAEIPSVLDKDIKVASSVYVTPVASTGMEVAPVITKPAETSLMDTTPAQIFLTVTAGVEPASAVTTSLSKEPTSTVTVPISNEPAGPVTASLHNEAASSVTAPVSREPAGTVTAPVSNNTSTATISKGPANTVTAPLSNEPASALPNKGPAVTATVPLSNEPAVAVTALLNAVSAVTAGARVMPAPTPGAGKSPASTTPALLAPTLSAPNAAWTISSVSPAGGTPSVVTAPGPNVTATVPRLAPFFSQSHTGAMKGTPVPGLPRTGTVTATISTGGGPTASLGAGKPPGIVVGSSLARSGTGATTIATGPAATKPPTTVTIAMGMGRSGAAGILPAISSGVGVSSAIIAGAGLPRTINIGGPSISAATPIGPTITKAAGIPPTVSITPIHVETTKEPAPLNLAPKVVRAEPVSTGAMVIPGVSIALASSNPAPFKPNISGPPKPPVVPPIAAVLPKPLTSAPTAPILPKPTSSVPPKPTTSTSVPPKPTSVPSKPTTSASVPPKSTTSAPAPPKPTTSASLPLKPPVLPSTAMLVSTAAKLASNILPSNLSRDELASMVSMAVAELQRGEQRLDKAPKPVTEPTRVSPPSLHANEEMLAEDSEEDEEEMDTETSSQISDVAPPSSSAHPLQASSSSLPPSTRSGSTSPYADDESFAMFVAQEASETACALDPETSSLSPSPSPTPTPMASEMLPASYEGYPSGSAVVQQFGITATCPPTPLQLNHEAPNAPLDMTTHNFPKRSKYAHRAAISAMHPYNRTRGGGGASVAKTLDLLKAVLQPSFNMEVKRLCDDYKHIYAMAASNIRENTGDTVPPSTLKLLIMKMIEEAHQGYLESKWEFPTGKLPVNDKVIATKGSPMTVKKLNRTEKDSRYGPAKRQRKPPSERQNDRSSGWRWGMDRRRLDPVKWDPDKLDLETDFVLGVNVNKALGHSANRGKVYYLHPELFKYACDGDDKTWLYENKHLPVHGGKAFLMIYSEVQTLVQTEECYKDNEDIANDVVKLEQFPVPQFMIDKMKRFMKSVQGYFIQENSQNSNSSSSSAVNKS